MGCDPDEKSQPTPIKEIGLEPSSLITAIGYKESITIKLDPSNRISEVTWKSSAPEVVEVDQKGNISPKALGKATIRATIEGKSASCEVEVIDPITQMDFTPESTVKTLYIGEQHQIELIVKPENADRSNITYSSSNEAVATVDKNGLITTVGVGDVEISAKYTFKDNSLEPKLSINVRPSIYVAGVINQNTAVIWKNGEMHELTDGGITAKVNDIFVSPKGDVYAVGYDTPDNTGINRAVLWVNGKMQYLSDGKKDTQAKSVVVVGNDVYIAGNEIGSKNKCYLWKNGTATILPTVKGYAEVGSLWIDGNNSYVVGYDDGPAIWENGEKKDMGLGDSSHQLLNLFIKGGDKYFVGYKSDDTGRDWAMLWKGDTPTPLSDGSADCYANAVWVSDNGDVYVAGNQGGAMKKALLWKNGKEMELSDDSYKAADLWVYDKELWVVGTIQTGGFPFGSQKAVIWNNGTTTILSDTRSEARAIFVRTK